MMTNDKSVTTLLAVMLVASLAGLGLASDPTIPELEEMISQAIRSHPEVVAARAQLLEAQAKLDSARLAVAQRIIEHQKIWRTTETQLRTEEAKLREMQTINERAPGSIPPPRMQVQEATVEAIRVDLLGLKSQTRFILGQVANESRSRVESDVERDLAEQMVTHAQTAYESAKALYEGGKDAPDVVPYWSRRLMEAEELAQGESAETAQRHLDRMQSLLETAKGRFEGGVTTAMSYAAARHAVAEAELLLKRRR